MGKHAPATHPGLIALPNPTPVLFLMTPLQVFQPKADKTSVGQYQPL